MRIRRKLRCSKVERVILAGALCLVAVCASAQENISSPQGAPSFTGLPLPLTLTQQFVLTNNLLFASPENQLRNVEIVYAYDRSRLLDVLRKNKDSGTSQQYFEIEELKDSQALWQMKFSYKARQLTVKNLPSDDKQSKRADRKVYLAISEDAYNKVLSEMPDQEDSNFMKETAQKFFLFQTQKSLASDDLTINQSRPTDTQS